MKELSVRKSTRLKGYDYSKAGCYFITICVKDKHEIFGQIVGDAHPGVPHNAHPGVPRVELNEIGNMVKQHVENIPLYYNAAKIDTYIIMPNHIHMILALECGTSLLNDGTPRCASPTKSLVAKIINAFKSLTSRQFGESMWQRSYHDHIIRNETDYRRIWQYIKDNPKNWAEDRYFLRGDRFDEICL